MNENERDPRGLTRRDFHRLGSAALVAACVSGVARRSTAANHQLVTEIAANKPVLEQIQYVNESQKEGQRCVNCVLYTAGKDGRGKCQILPEGLVKESGWCLTWSPKP